MTKQLKIYGSESAFMWGRLVFTDYATGCLRKIYLRARGVREQIRSNHQVRGAAFEAQYGQRLTGEVRAEESIRTPVVGYPDVTFSGRSDYIVVDADGVVVHELKSTESKTKLRQVKSGVYNTENLAQLVAYMVAKSAARGKLVYAYLEPEADGEYVKKYERTFEVSIDDYGRIHVDNKPTKYTVHDQLAHQQASADVIKNDIIYDRPANYAAAFGSPCFHCPFQQACTRWDAAEMKTADEFVQECVDTLRESEV